MSPNSTVTVHHIVKYLYYSIVKQHNALIPKPDAFVAHDGGGVFLFKPKICVLHFRICLRHVATYFCCSHDSYENRLRIVRALYVCVFDECTVSVSASATPRMFLSLVLLINEQQAADSSLEAAHGKELSMLQSVCDERVGSLARVLWKKLLLVTQHA